MFAVIVALPMPAMVTRPDPETVATAVLLDTYVTAPLPGADARLLRDVPSDSVVGAVGDVGEAELDPGAAAGRRAQPPSAPVVQAGHRRPG